MSRLSYSYSMISTYLRCPALFKLLFIDKVKPIEDESLALHFGTALHCGLNSLLEGGDFSSFDIYWESVRELPFPKGRYSWADLQEMGNTFLSRFQRLHMPHYTFITGENRIYGATPQGIRVEGTMDALIQYKGKVTLMDFKTSSMRYGDSKAETSMQLALYAYLAETQLNVKIEQVGYTVFLKQKEPSIQVQLLPLTRPWLNGMIENIEHICKDIETKTIFPKNYDTHMQYGRACPACTVIK